ncbi:hypothetical protein RUM43_004776 [Polyplax serrata]|uniref:Uncharacterized protein n=1 Tax=Polyplax serrata TaxID=468196 RepID=A0AAN8XNQ6_POLSC
MFSKILVVCLTVISWANIAEFVGAFSSTGCSGFGCSWKVVDKSSSEESKIYQIRQQKVTKHQLPKKLQVESLSVSKTTPAAMATPSRLHQTKVDDPALWKDICRVFNSGSNEGSSYESVKFHTAWSFESA